MISNVRDKLKDTLFEKINDQISKYKDKTSAPIIIVFNLTKSPDSDSPLSPFNHPLGHMPALASLGGHIVYGLVLGFMIFTFMSLMIR
jgi:hypothetical protein